MVDTVDFSPYVIRPGEEGHRSSVIEDTRSSFSVYGGGLEEAHPSALEAANGLTLRSTRSNAEGNYPGIDYGISVHAEDEEYEHLTWKQRISHVTWAFFTLTMATGGIANVLYNIPNAYRFSGLETIGIIIFLSNIVLYLIIWAFLIARFYFFPHMLKASFLHPTESLFIAAAAVSFGTILINISQYGPGHTGSWLVEAVQVLFWFDAGLAVILSASIYLLLWSTQTFTIAQMTPIWIFPVYPMLIIGPHAGVLSAQLSPSKSLTVIIGGFTIQGIGFLVSLMVYSAFIYRLMTQKLPKENIRPGMFVSVGPSAFTVAAIVNIANNAANCFPPDFMGNGPQAAMIVRVIANFASLWLWGLAIFFFFIATFANFFAIGNGGMIFSMGWFSFVFPNTALITATFAIGKAYSCKPIEIIGLFMTVMLILMYIFVVYMMIRAIKLHYILWPQKDEERSEGGLGSKTN